MTTAVTSAVTSAAPPKIVYVDDDLPGITRRRSGKGWAYLDAKGVRIAEREEIDRLNAVGMPPAYRDCWFCPSPDGHIQATGYDEKGRKQYRYHLAFRAAQEAAKYDRCAEFGRALPLVRARVESDLKRRRLGRDQAVASVVRLLDLGRVRVGNEGYAKANKSFGATTLRKRHAETRGQTIKLEYRAKSGKLRQLKITDGTLSRFVKRMQDLPGQQLFQWIDDDGSRHAVTSAHVNDYIREATGGDFTAKHFRTWGASVLAFRALAETKVPLSLGAMLEPVTEALGNTPAIARKSYVHPRLIALTKEGQREFRETCRLPRATRYLDRFERGLIALLDSPAPAARQAA